MPETPTTTTEAAPAETSVQPTTESGPEHTGPLTTEYMQNTLDEAFKTLPHHELLDSAKNPEAETATEKKAETTPEPVEEKQAEKAEAEEKAPEPEATDVDIVSPDDPEEKRQSTWNRLKKRAKEADAFEAQLKDFEGTRAEREALKTQIDAIRKEQEAILAERESMHAELYRSRIQAHPLFKEQVIDPFNVLHEAATNLAKENEIDPKELFDVIIKGDKKAMYEITAGMHQYDQSQVFDMFKDMRHVVAARDGLLADSKAAAEAFARQQEAEYNQYTSHTLESRNKALDVMVPKLTEKVVSILPENKRRDLNAMRQEAMDFDRWPDEIKMYGGIASVLLPEVLETYQTTAAELKAAKAEIAKLRGGSPKVVTKGQPATPSQHQSHEAVDYSKMSTDSLAEQAVARMRKDLGL